MPVIPNRPVHFTEAIDYMVNKAKLPTRTYTDVWQGMHGKAFVVAGAMKEELVTDFHEAIKSAIKNGTTLETFRKDFDHIVEKHGWSYKGGRNWRSRVIFQTNIDQANNAGRWAQAQDTKTRRPYLRYVAVDDGRTRQQHKDWHGTILPVDHVWWQTHHPKNGWNCRCSTQTLSEDDLRRYGWKVSESAPKIEMESKAINTSKGPKTIQVPKGIDPGFAYNPGEAATGRGEDLLKIESHSDDWSELSAPFSPRLDLDELPSKKPRVPPAPRGEGYEDKLRAALRTAIGGDEVLMTDPTGNVVKVSQAVVTHILEDPIKRGPDGRERWFPLYREIIEDPDEIWVGFATYKPSGQVQLRRRYVKVLDIGDQPGVLLVADQTGSRFQALTTFTRKQKGIAKIRTGMRVYSKSERERDGEK